MFYVMAEFQGSVIIAFLLQQLVNDVTKVTEVKRFYPHFDFLITLATILAGFITKYFSNHANVDALEAKRWGIMINYLTSILLTSGLGVILIYFFLNKFVFTDSRLCLLKVSSQARKKNQNFRQAKVLNF